MNSSGRDLSESVRFFSKFLPPTISTEILAFVAIYAEKNLDWDKPETFLPCILSPLEDANSVMRFGAVLRVVAALDYVLERATIKLQTAKEVMNSPAAEKLGPDIVNRFEASHPLRQRHQEKALADWRELRASALILSNLMDYEDSLLAPHSRI